MLVAFFDESYPKGLETYSVAAVVTDMVGLFDLAKGLRDVLVYAQQAYGVPPTAELHAHDLMQSRKGWEKLGGQHRAKEKIYTRALEAIVASGAKVFIEGLDVVRQRERYVDPYPPHQVTLSYALERISEYGASRDRSVLVMADEVPDQEQHAASMAFYSIVGTPGYRSSKLPQIIHPVRFEDSRLHLGLQAADMVAYLYNRRINSVERDQRAQAAKDRMWETLRPAVRHCRLWHP